MARRSLLQDSWNETREFVSTHARATAWGATALALVVISVAVAASRDDGSPDSKTTVRADESATQVSTPTTFFGNDLVVGPDSPRPTVASQTGVTLRNGNGLHLYTGTIPDYSGGAKSTTTAPAAGGGTTATTAPTGGGSGTTPFPPSVFATNRIAYVANGQTWTVNPDGTDARFVANSAYYPAWAASHTAIAVVDAQSPGGILSYITPAGARYALTPAPDGGGEGDSRPTWSPDGLRIAFGRIDFQGQGGYSSIWVINKDGQNAQRISVAGCFTADPSWSPDGTHIAFWSSRDHCSGGDPIGATELYVMNSNGTGVKRLGSGYNASAPSFSPDGAQIAFTSDRDGNTEIYVMDADGSNQTRVTTSSADESDPTWSPDGTRLAFSRNNTIYTVKPDGTDPKAIVAGSQPSWS